MQILGKGSKVLMTVLCAVMLIAIGISFAAWDGSAVKADSGNMSDYANAKVGDIVIFGKYYINAADSGGNFEKSPLEWLVVDKNERTGQLTLMTRYIVACGSYFGNYYDDGSGYGWKYNLTKSEVAGIPFNQAYCDSTLRAYLNNLERLDMGGDVFNKTGYVQSGKDSTLESGLLSNIGFSNRRYFTGLETTEIGDYAHIPGFGAVGNHLIYQRPITSNVFAERPAAKGFYDEAFTREEKSKIIPKAIAGYTGHRWPDNSNDISGNSYVEGSVDKVWAPSAAELNAIDGYDASGESVDVWTNASDAAGSNVFEYFKNYANYKNAYNRDKNNTSLEDALIGIRTGVACDGKAGNYSIPVYDYQSSRAKTEISSSSNTFDHYWTRSPSSVYLDQARFVQDSTGRVTYVPIFYSNIGVRPCIILQY